MGSNLSDHQLHIDCCMWKMLYANLMATTNQKLLISIQRIQRKKSNYTIIENQQTMKERKRRKDWRKATKTTTKEVTKWQ